jgi:hypothetical protein
MATLMRELFYERDCDLLEGRMIDSLATALERLVAGKQDTARAA